MKKILFLLLITSFIFTNAFGQDFQGQVKDSLTKAAIPYANIYLVELQTGATTNLEGIFTLPEKIKGWVHLQISCIGYESSIVLVDFSKQKNETFFLSQSHLQLHEVVVSTSSTKLQQDVIVSVVQKSISELNSNAPTNLSEAVSNIAGVDNYSTGSGIGKPVIRGLSGNRIVVYAQNVRMENQQWGDEHGLGIGEVGIENVEVIKGASSLLYGADAIGGVLYFTDERYAPLNMFESSSSSKFYSNTLGTFNEAGIKFNKNSFRINLFGGYNSNTDYQLSDGNRAYNSRFDEANFKTSIGYYHKKWIGNLRYSYLKNNFGITESDTTTNLKDRKPELPNQKIDNHLISFDNHIFLNKIKLDATLGYNQNNRKEFENSEIIPGLNLLLRTFTYNFKSSNSFKNKKLELISGIQGMAQKNENKSTEILIPDANNNDLGVYSMINYSLNKQINFEGGLRVDARNISTREMKTVETYFPKLNRNYYNFNYALGASFGINNIVTRINIASGSRAPNTSELLTNGEHEGTLRYEIGDYNLKSEKSTQFDFNLGYEDEHFNFYINPFLNYINDYIYLSPSDTIINNLMVYYYRQTNANLFGGESGFHWHPHPFDWLHIESNYSTVLAQDKSGNDLPLIPANKIQSSVKGEFKSKRNIKIESIFVEHIYRFKQNRISEFEINSSGYHLFNTGIKIKLNQSKNSFEMTTGIKNILNTKYIDHLSRLKMLGISNPGINVYIGFKWKFQPNKNLN